MLHYRYPINSLYLVNYWICLYLLYWIWSFNVFILNDWIWFILVNWTINFNFLNASLIYWFINFYNIYTFFVNYSFTRNYFLYVIWIIFLNVLSTLYRNINIYIYRDFYNLLNWISAWDFYIIWYRLIDWCWNIFIIIFI